MTQCKESERSAPPPTQQQQWPGKTETMRPKPDHGRAVAIAFAREDTDVAFAYYDEHEDAQETLKWIEDAQRKARCLSADLTHAQQCKQIVKMTVATLGHRCVGEQCSFSVRRN